MKTYKKISLILWMILISFTNVEAVTQQKKDALIALYNSTNGPGWTYNDNWANGGDPCDLNFGWYGVLCDYSGPGTIALSLEVTNLQAAFQQKLEI